ncbi:PTS fructose transporter subunit IIA [Marinicauda salina]|jgi:PTS system mannose-specific IIA component|uniref:PTS fructose transporter subunit IIA n=1 Tax=Marinicauda salina TaxID=2135793 RepID=A0A2U2BVZ0_9PROT|nr:PTS sugar transporter subunit IIA [Marinicauda salina]PWE18149.1 PTS fructose transporter subunit IIA [Marinicauda salina]
MIGIVVVTHGRLADELVAATEHVVGPLESCVAISIGPDDDMEKRRDDIREAVAEVDQGEGVVILTDMFGGTPSNLAISLLEKQKVEVIAGANLPMMIKLAEARARVPIHELAESACEAGKRYIAVASKILDGAA